MKAGKFEEDKCTKKNEFIPLIIMMFIPLLRRWGFHFRFALFSAK
jgi:hypothetical protein